MLFDVTNAIYVEDYKLQIEFENGRSGIVDFRSYLERGGVFLKWRNMDFFRRFSVVKDLGTVVWEDGVDISPETLYEKCLQSEHLVVAENEEKYSTNKDK